MTSASKQFISILGLLFTTVIWGATFILVKWTIEELDVYYFLFLRFFAATVFMLIIFGKRLRGIDKDTIFSSLILSILFGGSFILQTEGLSKTSATNTAMITGLYLVIIPIISSLFLKESIRLLSIIGCVFSIAGLYLLTQYNYSGISLGDLLALGCAFGFAWHIVLTGKFTKRHKTIPLVLFQFIFISIFFGIITLAKGSYTAHISEISWITIAITSILASVFALIIQTAAQKHVDPTRVGIIFALESVFGAFFACRIGGETITNLALAGAGLMLIGMILSEIHPIVKSLLKKIVG